MRTLQHLPEERRIKIAQETLDIYAPIANRLGMSKVKNELEELSFKYLEPKAYEALRAKVEAKRKTRRRRHRRADRGRSARKLEEAQVPVIAARRPHQAPLQHPPQAEAAEDRPRARLRLRRAARHHAVGQGLLRGARHHPPDLVAGARAASRTSSRCRGRTATSRCTRRSSASTAFRSRCRSAPRRCTAAPRKASPRTGSTRKAASATIATSATSSGCASCSRCSRRSAIRRSSCRT